MKEIQSSSKQIECFQVDSSDHSLDPKSWKVKGKKERRVVKPDYTYMGISSIEALALGQRVENKCLMGVTRIFRQLHSLPL